MEEAAYCIVCRPKEATSNSENVAAVASTRVVRRKLKMPFAASAKEASANLRLP